MAGSVKKRVDTGRWRARYRGPDGRERSKDFDRKGDADRWLREQTRRVDAGEWTDPRSGKVTVGEYAPQWLAGKVRLKETTRESYRGLLETQVLPTWERVPLSAVRHEDVAAWVQRLHKSGLSASRTRQAWIVLAQVLDAAVRARRIPANPARGVELPSLPTKAERPERMLTAEQVWALVEATQNPGPRIVRGKEQGLLRTPRQADRALVLLLAYGGLRVGEAAALRVRSVDLLRRELRVEATLGEVNGRLVESTPKTASSIRTVPLPEFLTLELAPLLDGKGPEDRVFTSPRGDEWRLTGWRRHVFDPAIRQAGIATQTKGDVFRPHDLRHTCASLHVQAGTPIKVLSELLGHASVSITLDRYSHLYPGDAAGWVDKLGASAVESRAAWVRSEAVDRVVPFDRVSAETAV